jgi:tetratricopeptide (TPR) repeat protein
MKYIVLSIALLFIVNTFSIAQKADSALLATAKSHIREGDYNNAIMILNRASSSDPANIEIQKDLAFAYYLKRDYASALNVAKPMADNPNADVQSFQILGMVYKAIEERKDCEKMYKAALKKFPASGVLYNEYGEMIWSKQEYTEAVKLWEKGIQSDPNFSGNYYNAAKYYYFSADKVWGLIYGEIFVNLESYSKRTTEIRNLLLDGYKKLFADADITKKQDLKNEFVKAFLENMKKNSGAVASGISPETLLHLRTRFIEDWFRKDAARFPFRLFDLQQQLLKNGMYNAYTQWVFGAAKDSTEYQAWTASHTEEAQKFSNFQKGRIFRMAPGQYYQKPGK